MTDNQHASQRGPIAVALDAPDLATACDWAGQVGPYVQFVKVGLESYLRDAASGVAQIRQAAGPDVGLFLDLKLHDIPNTVAGAVRSVMSMGPGLLTIHASGGSAMVAAAAEAAGSTRIAAVTVLTSLSEQDLAQIGLAGPSIEAVKRLAVLAVDSGARALVCSPLEVAEVRRAVGPDVLLITPGVRPVGTDIADQQRVSTPEQALAAGADLLVIGRPITGAVSPRAAAAEIAASLR